MPDTREAAHRWLADHGAADIPHPGGTLLQHLDRVADRLQRWRVTEATVLAGLCHAVYGTDGFDTRLLDPGSRDELRRVIGDDAERLVYLYGSCRRESVYPQLPDTGPVTFTDRFTDTTSAADDADTAAFVHITAANEIDVMLHNPELAAKHAANLYNLFSSARHRLCDAGWADCAALTQLATDLG